MAISATFASGLKTEFISTKNLCAGRYEFWFVVRSMNGSTLQYVKPFFSEYPSCTKKQTRPCPIFSVETEVFEEEMT